MRQKYHNIIVNLDDTILFVLKKMDVSNRKLMIVLNGTKFISVISIGDIQRAIIKNIDLDSPIRNILRPEISVATTQDDYEKLKERMKKRRNELMPIVSLSGELVDIIFWEDLFKEERTLEPQIKLDLPVIIMAGGKGSRLKPLTNILPKPLIPINSKTIIEDIMDRFVAFGCHSFFILVNYKADLIRYYFESLKNPLYHIQFSQEDIPLGTAGGLSLLKGKIDKTFFVSNCDILIDQDYSQILDYHRENKNEITIVAAMKHYPIPYGTIKSGCNGQLIDLIEKPELTIKINSGMYIIEPHLLNEIPDNVLFHITDLIDNIKSRNGKIGVFPVSEKSWNDMGSLSDYKFKPELILI